MIRSQGLLSKLHDGSRAVVAASNSKRLVRKKPRSFKHLKNHHDNKNVNAWIIRQLFLDLYRVLVVVVVVVAIVQSAVEKMK